MIEPTATTTGRGLAVCLAVAALSGCHLLTGPTAVTIHSFTAAPVTVTSGAQTTLSWDVDGADTIQIDNGIGAVEAKGTRVISPPWTSLYTMTAHGGSLTTHAIIQVQVVPKPQPPAGTPGIGLPNTTPSPSPSPSNPSPSPAPTPTPNSGSNPVARAHVGVMNVVCGGTAIPNSMNLTSVPVGCKVHLDLNLKDSHNHPTSPQGPMNWHFTNGNAFEVFEPDQWSPIMKSVGRGSSQVSVTVDGVTSNVLDLTAY